MFPALGFPEELRKQMPGLFDEGQAGSKHGSRDQAPDADRQLGVAHVQQQAYGADAMAMVSLARQRLDGTAGNEQAKADNSSTSSNCSTKTSDACRRQQEGNPAAANVVQLVEKLRQYSVPDPGALRSLHNIPDDISPYLPAHLLQSYKQVHVTLANYKAAEEQDLKWRQEAELAKLEKKQVQQRMHLLATEQKLMMDGRWMEFPSSLQEQLHASIFDKVQAMSSQHMRIKAEFTARCAQVAQMEAAAIRKRYADWRWWQNLLILRQYPAALEALSVGQSGAAGMMNPAMLAASGLNQAGLQQMMMMQQMAAATATSGSSSQDTAALMQQLQLQQLQLAQQQQRGMSMQGASGGTGVGDYLTGAERWLDFMRIPASSSTQG